MRQSMQTIQRSQKENVAIDLHRGVLIAKKKFDPGQTIFIEESLLWVPRSLQDCIACGIPHVLQKCKTKAPKKRFMAFERALSIIPILSRYYDIPSELLILSVKIAAYSNMVAPLLLSLSKGEPVVSMDLRAVIGQLWNTFPESIKNNSILKNVDTLIKTMYVWKLHSFDLPGGSRNGCLGLFEHISYVPQNCNANACIATFSKRAILSATRHIPAGSVITLCYIDPYLNREERQTELRTHYGILCSCKLCTAEYDSRHCFCCPSCKKGIVHAHKQNMDQWKCTSCDAYVPLQTVGQWMKMEQESHTTTQLMQAGFHKFNSSIYGAALKELNIIFDEGKRNNSNHRKIANLLKLLLLNIESVKHVTYHPKKASAYEQIGNIYTLLNDHKTARSAYLNAYYISALCSGIDTTRTIHLKNLAYFKTPSWCVKKET